MEETQRKQFRPAIDCEKLSVSRGLFEREAFWRLRLHFVKCLWPSE